MAADQAPTAVQPAATPWAPTHAVPAGGMNAWAEPNPQLQPVTRLAAGVQLRIDEQRGAWAKVTGSNMWTGWVDSRRLQLMGAASAVPSYAPAGAAATRPAGMLDVGGLMIRPLPLIGGALLIVATFLTWLDFYKNSFHTTGFEQKFEMLPFKVQNFFRRRFRNTNYIIQINPPSGY